MGFIPYNKNEIERGERSILTFDVEFYKQSDGKCPIKGLLDSLDNKLRAKVLRTIELLEQNGNELREPYSKHLEDGIFELRVKQGTDNARILYFFVIGHTIVLTNGFIKKAQKTPKSEIELAKRCRANYLVDREEHS